MAAWSLILRNGPSVERQRYGTLDEALGALEQRVEGLAQQARREPVTVFRRRFEAVQQVAARGELAGPTRLLPAVRGGVRPLASQAPAARAGRDTLRRPAPRAHPKAFRVARAEWGGGAWRRARDRALGRGSVS